MRSVSLQVASPYLYPPKGPNREDQRERRDKQTPPAAAHLLNPEQLSIFFNLQSSPLTDHPDHFRVRTNGDAPYILYASPRILFGADSSPIQIPLGRCPPSSHEAAFVCPQAFGDIMQCVHGLKV